MCAALNVLQKFALLGLLAPLSAAFGAERAAEHISLWGGGGVGAMLVGEGAVFVNGHKMGMLSATLPGQKFRVRLMKGSLERTQGIQSGTGDNDVDYRGFDLVVTEAATHLPVAFAIGAARYEEAFHRGYPDQDFGGSAFVHRWGPHVSVLRSWEFGRFAQTWAELDLHYIPYDTRQVVLFLDVGVGLRL